MTDEDILNAIEDQKEALFNLRFQDASGQLEDPNQLKRTRRDIARLKTILRERQLAAEHVKKENTNA
jgi:large subunit ribosomal protein L29